MSLLLYFLYVQKGFFLRFLGLLHSSLAGLLGVSCPFYSLRYVRTLGSVLLTNWGFCFWDLKIQPCLGVCPKCLKTFCTYACIKKSHLFTLTPLDPFSYIQRREEFRHRSYLIFYLSTEANFSFIRRILRSKFVLSQGERFGICIAPLLTSVNTYLLYFVDLYRL